MRRCRKDWDVQLGLWREMTWEWSASEVLDKFNIQLIDAEIAEAEEILWALKACFENDIW